MSNSFHLLVEEPDRANLPPLDNDGLLQRIGYSTTVSPRSGARGAGSGAARRDRRWEEELLDRHRRRRGDVSIFMKELKQHFSSCYNRRKGGKGSLWEERF